MIFKNRNSTFKKKRFIIQEKHLYILIIKSNKNYLWKVSNKVTNIKTTYFLINVIQIILT